MTDLNIQIAEDSVKDCLAHLYDYTFLQDHHLVRIFVPHAQGNASRVEGFQQVVFEAIARLKPRDSANPFTKNMRLYNILYLRYQQQQQVHYVLKQLNLGERQFYRDHAKAVQTLAHVLNEILRESDILSVNAFSIHSELERVQRQNVSVNITINDFLRKTLMAIRSLSERQHSELHIQPCDAILPSTLDQTLLRQAIIWIVAQLVTESPSASCFTISFAMRKDSAYFTFARTPNRGEALAGVEARRLIHQRYETLETLLNELEASVFERADEEQTFGVVLEIPIRQHSLLIIDDNPDVIGLFRQFFAGRPYQLLTASDSASAITIACEMHPEFIILDVLLPNQDGWEILQQLKNHPVTVDTPVLICSVLDAQDLALLLGADGFLHKPPEEHEFMDAVKRLNLVM